MVVGGSRDTLNVAQLLKGAGFYQVYQRRDHTSTEEVLSIIDTHSEATATVFVFDAGEAADDLYRDLKSDNVTVYKFKTVEDIYRLLGLG